MDAVLERLVEYTAEVELQDFTESAIHAAKRMLVDTIGCTIAGIVGEYGEVALALANNASGSPGATVFGLEGKSSLEMATFANSASMQYLNFNDFNPPGAHYSAMIPALLAAAEATNASGSDLLLAVACAYETAAEVNKQTKIPSSWDRPTLLAGSVALAVGRLFGLTRAQLKNATSLALLTNIVTREFIGDPLASWYLYPACATNKNAVAAVLMALAGVTAPEHPFDGKVGLLRALGGGTESFEIELPADKTFAVEKSCIKLYPVQDYGQSPVQLMLSIRDQFLPEDVESVRLDSFSGDYKVDGQRSNPDKWKPRSRQMADHSVPYTMSIALIDGEVTAQTLYGSDRWADPSVLALMDRVALYLNPDYQRVFPEEWNNHLTVRLRSGAEIEAHSVHPVGHSQNPASDELINQKFDQNVTTGTIDSDACRAIRDMCWELDAMDNIAALFDRISQIRPL